MKKLSIALVIVNVILFTFNYLYAEKSLFRMMTGFEAIICVPMILLTILDRPRHLERIARLKRDQRNDLLQDPLFSPLIYPVMTMFAALMCNGAIAYGTIKDLF